MKKIQYLKNKSYKDLTSKEWDLLRKEEVVNGCGGAGKDVKNFLIRATIKWLIKKLRVIFIEASCEIHDFTYWQGGDEEQRLKNDRGFFVKIIDDIEKLDKSTSVIFYTILALCFYYAVRYGGKDYFQYSK